MKVTRLSTLILTLILSGLPALAQERGDAIERPIGRAITYVAARMAASPVDPRAHAEEPMDAAWSRVRKLDPGTEVIVSADGAPFGLRYFLSADDSGVVVLNLSETHLPPRVASVLRKAAVTHPQSLWGARERQAFVLDDHIRLDPDGLFVAGRKAATLAQIVERIERAQIGTLRLAHGNSVGRGTGGGALVGLGAGFLLGLVNDCGRCDSSGLVTLGASVWGAGLGAAAGFVVGEIKESIQTEHGGMALYTAPSR